MAHPAASSAPIGTTYTHEGGTYLVSGHMTTGDRIISHAIFDNNALITDAIQAAADAQAAETNAVTNASSASNAAGLAQTAQTAAESAQTAAETAETNTVAVHSSIASTVAVVSDDFDRITAITESEFAAVSTPDARVLYTLTPDI